MILFPLVVNYTLLHQASEWIADASDGSMAVSISTVMPEQPSVAYDFVRKIDDHFRSVVPKVILENLRAFKRLRDSSKDTSAKYVQLTIKSLSDQLKSKFMDQIQDSNLAQKRPRPRFQKRATVARKFNYAPAASVIEKTIPKEVATPHRAPFPAIKPSAFVFPMKTRYGLELISALHRYEVLLSVVAKLEPEIEEAEAHKILMNARWSSLLQANEDTVMESSRLKDDPMHAEKLEAFIFRQPHPDWDSNVMHNFLIQRFKCEISTLKYEEAVHQIPKSEDLLEAEEKLESLLGGYKLVPRFLDSDEMNRLTRFILEDESGQEVSTNDITGSLEHKDIFFKKPSTNVYQEDVEYFMVSPQGVPDNLAGQSLEVLQDRYANIAFLFEKDTNYLTSKKLKLAVFESMMETLTTQFPEYAKIPQLLQRMITRQRLEIQIWERLVVNNLKVFQSADYALAMKGYEMELGEMEMSLKAAKKVRKPIILNAMDKYRNSELQAITTKLQDKFTRLFHLVLIAPKQIEVLPPRMHLVKKSEMSNELWEEEFQSSLGSELVRRVLSPALAAMRQEASNLLPGIFVA